MSNFYERTKQIVKGFIPEAILFKYELPLRRIYSISLRGNRFECNVCSSRLKDFIQLNRGDQLCPVCGSLPRHRRLLFFLQSLGLQGKLLHFSPSRALYRVLDKIPDLDYQTTDYETSYLVDHNYDITAIPLEDNQFDFILCYHVLEHIPDDRAAMSELYRVLKPGGKAIIQTPFKEGKIYEDASIIKPEERLKHFGQEDHVRVYSVTGLAQRLKDARFSVEVNTFEVDTQDIFGLKDQEVILVAKK